MTLVPAVLALAGRGAWWLLSLAGPDPARPRHRRHQPAEGRTDGPQGTPARFLSTSDEFAAPTTSRARVPGSDRSQVGSSTTGKRAVGSRVVPEVVCGGTGRPRRPDGAPFPCASSRTWIAAWRHSGTQAPCLHLCRSSTVSLPYNESHVRAAFAGFFRTHADRLLTFLTHRQPSSRTSPAPSDPVPRRRPPAYAPACVGLRNLRHCAPAGSGDHAEDRHRTELTALRSPGCCHPYDTRSATPTRSAQVAREQSSESPVSQTGDSPDHCCCPRTDTQRVPFTPGIRPKHEAIRCRDRDSAHLKEQPWPKSSRRPRRNTLDM